MPATEMNLSWRRCLGLAASLLVFALPVQAAKKTLPVPFNGDLTTPSIKHGAECPLPKQRSCLIRKPVGKSYRLLTPGVNLEDLGEYWVADLSKIKDPKSNKAWLQIWGGNNELHEIEILFPKEPVVKEAPPPGKEPAPLPKDDENKPES
ncbi:MAG: hypothetical protein WC100_10105 [Sterolibacterium sp.]